jgi:hypothetical protein
MCKLLLSCQIAAICSAVVRFAVHLQILPPLLLCFLHEYAGIYKRSKEMIHKFFTFS